ncbi:F-box domain, cyclin-like protein [Artemisia annua]|uniref:F-box domain, cyclin-like protein n=1 Tax=Artemisia annua TaxID=35608 RepID=A0A2U1KP69_ARTAN|nr:F-box domain, cyclin-like protein [Artemisia annua]
MFCIRPKLNIVVQKTEFDPGNGLVGSEDRISSLPDELLHQILSFIDTKYAVQTSMLSSRWKLLWTSVPCLDLASYKFRHLPKFSKFVTNVLSHRNHQIDVSSVKLDFSGAASQAFVRKIANYAFSHNVQELTVTSWPKKDHEFPPCLFSSQSLKHFTFSSSLHDQCLTPKTPWDFPALTTLHLSEIILCDDNRESIDLFSKCVNLRNLTLENFRLGAHVEEFNIITPRLSNLKLIKGRLLKAINLVAPQLESLTIIDCPISYLNLPPRISSLCYKSHNPPKWFKDSCHSVNKVTVSLSYHSALRPYNEEDFRETVNMLQELRSAKFLTLSFDIIECISAFPDLLAQHPSPFSNLISLYIDSSWGKNSYKVKMSTEATNFLLENSPNATPKLNIVVQKTEFDPGNGLVGSEDRISSLPDELLHQILSFIDTKYAVQTSMLSSRWKLLWTSVPCLDLASYKFRHLPKFSKFVTNVLSHRNHQIDVSSVKLDFSGAASQAFVRKIANYAFSHNVQELTVTSWPKKDHEFPPCLFSSQSLKHFTFSSSLHDQCLTPKTPWDFPALTTLHLSEIILCDDNHESIDLFSKCVNLRNLTLENFRLGAHVEEFNIITPRLSNLKLIKGRLLKAINLVAPQLESLTIIDCPISYLNLPPRISSLCYKSHNPPKWFKDSCHSVNKVTVSLSYHSALRPYNEEDFRETVNMLQELRSAKFLTLSFDIIEPPPTKAMKAKAVREKNAKLIADIELHMKELQALVKHGNEIIVQTEKTKVNLENIIAELLVWINNKMTQSEEVKQSVESRPGVQLATCLGEVQVMIDQGFDDSKAIDLKKWHVRSLIECLPKRQMAVIESRYSSQLEETETLCVGLRSTSKDVCKILKKMNDYLAKNTPDKTLTFQDASSSKLLQASEPSSSSSATINRSSSSSTNPMP